MAVRKGAKAEAEVIRLPPKEGVHAIEEAEPKAKAKPKPKLVSGIGGDKYDPRTGERISTISDEVRSIQEQITHYNTGVDRIYNTIELSDYFNSKPGSETEGATCYVPPSAVDPKAPPDGKESLDDLPDRVHLPKPGF